MGRNSLCFVCAAIAISLATAHTSAADDLKFELMAPKGSALVLECKNVHGTVARLEASPIGQLQKDAAIESSVAASRSEVEAQRKEQLQRMGIDLQEVPWPGPMGIALFVEHNEELDAPELGLLFWADYQERADDAGKMFDGVIRELEKDSQKPFEQVEIAGGVRATRIVLPVEAEEEPGRDPQPPSRRRPRGIDALGEITSLPEAVYFIRSGSQFFAASSIPALEDAMAVSAGKSVPCVADTEDWRGVVAFVGERDVSVTLLTAPIQELIAPIFAGPMASSRIAANEMFGDVRAWSFSLGTSDGASFADVSISAYVPGTKVGLMEILSNATPIQPPPVLLGDDAVVYQRFNVRFENIMEMIEDVVASLPEQEADAIAPMLQQYAPGLGKAFSSLGPEVSTVGRKAPDGVEGMRTFTAIRCTDEKATNALLATILPSAGMMPRDFQGQIVYGGEGIGMELGLGGGSLLIGSPEAVEQSLRSAGDASTKSLAENELYIRALSALAPGSVVGWGYADMPVILDQNRKALLSMDETLAAESGGAAGGGSKEDDKDAATDVLIPTRLNPATIGSLEKVDLALLNRYFGPLVWEIRSDTKGLTARAMWLRAVEQPKDAAK